MDEDYRNLKSTECTRKIDNMLARYLKERNTVVSDLSEKPVKLANKMWEKILSNDPLCMVNCGLMNRYSSYACAPCININRIVDFETTELGTPFIIECGKKVGTYLTVLKISTGGINIEVSDSDKAKAVRFLKDNGLMLSCGSQDISPLTFLRSDDFSNNILNWWTIDSIFEKKKLPYSLPLYTAFLCRNDGFILFESPTLGNYYQIIDSRDDLKETVVSIFKQLGVILDVLSPYHFSHGNPCGDVLVFTDEEMSHAYKGINITSEFTMHLADFTYSSLTTGKTRIYPRSDRSSKVLNSTLDISIKDGLYRLSNKSEVIFAYVRHAGLPIYSCSLDLYCFVVSIMSIAKVFNIVKKDESLNSLWRSIWSEGDINEVERVIAKYPNIDPIKLLSRKWLQCSVINTWLEGLKEL
jgi:hypothetical protein